MLSRRQALAILGLPFIATSGEAEAETFPGGLVIAGDARGRGRNFISLAGDPKAYFLEHETSEGLFDTYGKHMAMLLHGYTSDDDQSLEFVELRIDGWSEVDRFELTELPSNFSGDIFYDEAGRAFVVMDDGSHASSFYPGVAGTETRGQLEKIKGGCIYSTGDWTYLIQESDISLYIYNGSSTSDPNYIDWAFQDLLLENADQRSFEMAPWVDDAVVIAYRGSSKEYVEIFRTSGIATGSLYKSDTKHAAMATLAGSRVALLENLGKSVTGVVLNRNLDKVGKLAVMRVKEEIGELMAAILPDGRIVGFATSLNATSFRNNLWGMIWAADGSILRTPKRLASSISLTLKRIQRPYGKTIILSAWREVQSINSKSYVYLFKFTVD